jgi:DNA-directed RNA polymerase specialized sigma24 family protein
MGETTHELLARLDAEHKGPVCRLLYQHTCSKADTEVLAPEAFVRLHMIPREGASQNPAGYLFTIANHLARERGRHEPRESLDGLPHG